MRAKIDLHEQFNEKKPSNLILYLEKATLNPTSYHFQIIFQRAGFLVSTGNPRKALSIKLLRFRTKKMNRNHGYENSSAG